MATIRQFEDLLAWQKARELTKFIYDISKYRNFDVDRGLQDQIRRAAVSVMSNIAEGFESGTRQEFLNYLYIAKASAGEVRAQLYAAHDIGYLNIETFKHLSSLAVGCSRLIASFIKSLKQSQFGGVQFKKEKSKAQMERDEFDAAAAKYLEERKKNPAAEFDISRFQQES